MLREKLRECSNDLYYAFLSAANLDFGIADFDLHLVLIGHAIPPTDVRETLRVTTDMH